MYRYLLIGLLLVLPLETFAQFGPIVPEVCRTCACGFGGVLAIIQNLINFVISLAIIIATLVLMWGAVLYITSPANPEHRSTANKMLINAFVGLLIVLSAWLMVDFVMKTLYGGQFGPWNSILTAGTGSTCVESKPNNPLFDGNIFAIPGQHASSTGTGSNCPAADPALMVAFPAAATSGGAEKATGQTVQNFSGMRAAALKEGIDLKVTDGYRPESEQIALWNQHCSSGTCGATKVAKPCSLGGNGSNHNSGLAVDINVGCSNGSTCDTKAYKWLKANGATWNFRNAIPTDPVHWSPSGH